MRHYPEHRSVHGKYNPYVLMVDQTVYSSTCQVSLPLPPADTLVYPNPSKGYVSEVVKNVDFLEIFE